jgi:hypothetical protein
MKQTAVEWLQNELFTEEYMRNNLFEIFQQALELEKQQIIDAVNSQRQLGWDEKGEQYYNETYKKP